MRKDGGQHCEHTHGCGVGHAALSSKRISGGGGDGAQLKHNKLKQNEQSFHLFEQFGKILRRF